MGASSLESARSQAGWAACCSRGCGSWLLPFPIISVLSDLTGPAKRAALTPPHTAPAAIGAARRAPAGLRAGRGRCRCAPAAPRGFHEAVLVPLAGEEACGQASAAARPLGAADGRKCRYEAASAGVPPSADRQRHHRGQDTVSAPSPARGRRSGPLRRLTQRGPRSQDWAGRHSLPAAAHGGGASHLSHADGCGPAERPPTGDKGLTACRLGHREGWILFRSTGELMGDPPPAK